MGSSYQKGVWNVPLQTSIGVDITKSILSLGRLRGRVASDLSLFTESLFR